MEISIIVPIYNTPVNLFQKSLESLVTAVSAVPRGSVECLLIDDGSTMPHIGKMVKTIVDDVVFKYARKENGGVSTARNYGLELAKGNYVMAVDPDDWIEPDTLKIAIEMTRKESVDALCLGTVIDNGINEERYHEEIVGRDEVRKWVCKITSGNANALMHNHNIRVISFCARLYRRNIIEDNHLRFDKDLSAGEDFLFNLCYYDYCDKIVLDNKIVYHYVTNAESLIHKFSDMRLQAGIVFMSRIESYYHNQMNDSVDFKRGVCYQLLTTLRIALQSYFAHSANKHSLILRYRGLRDYLEVPVIKRWTSELSWRDGRNLRLFTDIMLLKIHLYWVLLLTLPARRRLGRTVRMMMGWAKSR